MQHLSYYGMFRYCLESRWGRLLPACERECALARSNMEYDSVMSSCVPRYLSSSPSSHFHRCASTGLQGRAHSSRILPLLDVPTCANFIGTIAGDRHYSTGIKEGPLASNRNCSADSIGTIAGKWHYSTGTTEGPLLYITFSLRPALRVNR